MWTPDQVKSILGVFQQIIVRYSAGSPYRSRLGELLGLQWKNIDLEGGNCGSSKALARATRLAKDSGKCSKASFGESTYGRLCGTILVISVHST